MSWSCTTAEFERQKSKTISWNVVIILCGFVILSIVKGKFWFISTWNLKSAQLSNQRQTTQARLHPTFNKEQLLYTAKPIPCCRHLACRRINFRRKTWKERWIVEFSKPTNSVPVEHVSSSYFHLHPDKGILRYLLSSNESEYCAEPLLQMNANAAPCLLNV